MKKNILLILGTTLSLGLQAQVGINTTTPHASSALDVESTTKGVLLPRLTTDQKLGITNPAPGLLVYDTNLKCISQNAGTDLAPQWVCLSQKDNQSSFFYMPSIAIDASVVATGKTLDLYAEYKKQFQQPTVASTGAPGSIPYFPVATDLYYYVTYYDVTVLQITGIDASGVMTYNIIQEANYASFMNVIIVIQ